MFPGSANGSNTDISARALQPPLRNTDAVAVNQSGGVNLKQTFAAIKAWVRSGTTAGDEGRRPARLASTSSRARPKRGQAQNAPTVTMTIASPCVVTWGTTVPYTNT